MTLDVLRYASAFHRRHLLLVTALSLVPVVQRFVSQTWQGSGPVAAASGEAATEVARLVLLIVVVRLAIPAEVAPRGERWRRVRAFCRDHWPSLLIQVGLLLIATAIFKFVPDLLIEPRVPAERRDAYRAVLLAVKNLTIIPFTIIWIVAAVRQMMLRTAVLVQAR